MEGEEQVQQERAGARAGAGRRRARRRRRGRACSRRSRPRRRRGSTRSRRAATRDVQELPAGDAGALRARARLARRARGRADREGRLRRLLPHAAAGGAAGGAAARPHAELRGLRPPHGLAAGSGVAAPAMVRPARPRTATRERRVSARRLRADLPFRAHRRSCSRAAARSAPTRSACCACSRPSACGPRSWPASRSARSTPSSGGRTTARTAALEEVWRRLTAADVGFRWITLLLRTLGGLVALVGVFELISTLAGSRELSGSYWLWRPGQRAHRPRLDAARPVDVGPLRRWPACWPRSSRGASRAGWRGGARPPTRRAPGAAAGYGLLGLWARLPAGLDAGRAVAAPLLGQRAAGRRRGVAGEPPGPLERLGAGAAARLHARDAGPRAVGGDGPRARAAAHGQRRRRRAGWWTRACGWW